MRRRSYILLVGGLFVLAIGLSPIRSMLLFQYLKTGRHMPLSAAIEELLVDDHTAIRLAIADVRDEAYGAADRVLYRSGMVATELMETELTKPGTSKRSQCRLLRCLWHKTLDPELLLLRYEMVRVEVKKDERMFWMPDEKDGFFQDLYAMGYYEDEDFEAEYKLYADWNFDTNVLAQKAEGVREAYLKNSNSIAAIRGPAVVLTPKVVRDHKAHNR